MLEPMSQQLAELVKFPGPCVLFSHCNWPKTVLNLLIFDANRVLCLCLYGPNKTKSEIIPAIALHYEKEKQG